MPDLETYLRGSSVAPWLSAPLVDDWAKVLHLGTMVQWEKKQIVHEMNRPATEIILILSGLLSINAMSSNGDLRNICILGPGSMLGEASLLADLRNCHITRAVEAGQGVVFSKDVVVNHIISKYSSLSLALCRNLARKSYIMSTQLECDSFMTGQQKIAHFLYHLALEQGRSGEIGRRIARLSLVSISEILGMHRVTVTNMINDFKRRGILGKEEGRLVVHDSAALLQMLAGQEG